MSTSQSIFGVWRHKRVICNSTTSLTHIIMTYKDLFGGICGERVPSDGFQYNVHVWSSHTMYPSQTIMTGYELKHDEDELSCVQSFVIFCSS